MGRFETTDTRAIGTGVSAFFVAEKLTFQQVFV